MLSAAPQIRQRPAPDLLQIIGEWVQRKPQRLFEGVPEPARTLRFQLIGIQANRSLKKCPVEPQLGIEVGRERHGLALAPFRRAMPWVVAAAPRAQCIIRNRREKFSASILTGTL